MTNFWTLHCFWAGLKTLLFFIGGGAAIMGLVFASAKLSDAGYSSYVTAFWVTVLAAFIVLIGMLKCNG